MDNDKTKKYQTVKAYHQQTKHYPYRSARSLGYMDWKNQPEPYRWYQGASQLKLPLITEDRELPYDAIYHTTDDSVVPVTISTLSRILSLSMGLSAWKKFGQSQWALRMNPSSGNLHPTECYLILPQLESQPPCVTHYNPYHHHLEMLTPLNIDTTDWLNQNNGFGIVLTTIPWREAWKYGERAFRYCNHDVGHALGAIRIACNLNGWRMTMIPQISSESLNKFLGFDQLQFEDGEPEHCDCLCWIDTKAHAPAQIAQWFQSIKALTYTYQPNCLSCAHVQWDIIDTVEKASRQDANKDMHRYTLSRKPIKTLPTSFTAEAIIKKRRSAQHYDKNNSRTNVKVFCHTLAKTLPRQHAPFDLWPYAPQVHLAIFVHAVDDLPSGLYMFVRNDDHLNLLKDATDTTFLWQQVNDDLPLYLLQPGDFRSKATALSCTQDIAGDSAFSLGMIARFDEVIKDDAAKYPKLFWETGLIGQVLYLEAEAYDLRGTGIGCFFDDEMHAILGIMNTAWQSLYHFTVGKHIDDARLETVDPYIHLKRR